MPDMTPTTGSSTLGIALATSPVPAAGRRLLHAHVRPPRAGRSGTALHVAARADKHRLPPLHEHRCGVAIRRAISPQSLSTRRPRHRPGD